MNGDMAEAPVSNYIQLIDALLLQKNLIRLWFPEQKAKAEASPHLFWAKN